MSTLTVIISVFKSFLCAFGLEVRSRQEDTQVTYEECLNEACIPFPLLPLKNVSRKSIFTSCEVNYLETQNSEPKHPTARTSPKWNVRESEDVWRLMAYAGENARMGLVEAVVEQKMRLGAGTRMGVIYATCTSAGTLAGLQPALHLPLPILAILSDSFYVSDKEIQQLWVTINEKIYLPCSFLNDTPYRIWTYEEEILSIQAKRKSPSAISHILYSLLSGGNALRYLWPDFVKTGTEKEGDKGNGNEDRQGTIVMNWVIRGTLPCQCRLVRLVFGHKMAKDTSSVDLSSLGPRDTGGTRLGEEKSKPARVLSLSLLSGDHRYIYLFETKKLLPAATSNSLWGAVHFHQCLRLSRRSRPPLSRTNYVALL
ncbi:hypothetical protein DL96DRAFT_1560472 [Flagelloscypha sp. PMI_526]|nr:hypothetical protein DL96DRAFT_1560472 [Flagelloscypha sp. PMI_526]